MAFRARKVFGSFEKSTPELFSEHFPTPTVNTDHEVENNGKLNKYSQGKI